jgi:hypothetical protein
VLAASGATQPQLIKHQNDLHNFSRPDSTKKDNCGLCHFYHCDIA